ncbi:MAG: MaoC family dehydratase [Syntrophales bacterium]|jgi:acyl dehydratase|nr:MaoC family dehydratase [Syntrophales bacterium]MDX9921991.1 MaoC family dehydratase [Syntrophales bacterium]
MKTLYFEDFKAGDRFESPGITVTESQIIDFAMHYDPQPFHMNVEAAGNSIFGGLIASGIHTMALMFRLFLMTGVISASNLGSPGIDELKWLKPVRPGDTLKAVGEVLEIIPSGSKPDRGIIRFRFSAVNQHNETVLTQIGNQIIARRSRSG